jgi:hypothetical protein
VVIEAAEGATGTRASVAADEVGVVAVVVAVVVEGEDTTMIMTVVGVTITIALRKKEGAMMRIMVTRGDVEVAGTMIDMTAVAVIIHRLEIMRVDLRVMVCLFLRPRALVPR